MQATKITKWLCARKSSEGSQQARRACNQRTVINHEGESTLS